MSLKEPIARLPQSSTSGQSRFIHMPTHVSPILRGLGGKSQVCHFIHKYFNVYLERQKFKKKLLIPFSYLKNEGE